RIIPRVSRRAGVRRARQEGALWSGMASFDAAAPGQAPVVAAASPGWDVSLASGSPGGPTSGRWAVTSPRSPTVSSGTPGATSAGQGPALHVAPDGRHELGGGEAATAGHEWLRRHAANRRWSDPLHGRRRDGLQAALAGWSQ